MRGSCLPTSISKDAQKPPKGRAQKYLRAALGLRWTLLPMIAVSAPYLFARMAASAASRPRGDDAHHLALVRHLQHIVAEHVARALQMAGFYGTASSLPWLSVPDCDASSLSVEARLPRGVAEAARSDAAASTGDEVVQGSSVFADRFFFERQRPRQLMMVMP